MFITKSFKALSYKRKYEAMAELSRKQLRMGEFTQSLKTKAVAGIYLDAYLKAK